MSLTKLSDPHNFGNFVKLTADGWVEKPRPLFWEWLFYSRNLLRDKLEALDLVSAFPILKFEGEKLGAGGKVQKLNLRSPSHLSESEYFAIGQIIAVYAFFGCADLHRDNIMFGLDDLGAFRFCSIDVENIFTDMADAGQTGLLPTLEIPDHICGLANILSLNGATSPIQAGAAVCAGYISAIDRLIKNESELFQTIIGLLGELRPPIRVVARKTISYVRFLKSKTYPRAPESTLCEPELNQLNRQDVPYFFRWPDSEDLAYWAKPECAEVVTTILKDQFKFPPVLTLEKQKFSPRKNGHELKQRGALQILRAFVREADFEKEASYKDVNVSTASGQIRLKSKELRLACLPMQGQRANKI